MRHVSLRVAPTGDKDIVLSLHHEREVFPEPGYTTWPAHLLSWAEALTSYIAHQEPQTRLYLSATPFIEVTRHDHGHTMRWSATQYDGHGVASPYDYAFDVDIVDFATQVYKALIALQEWPQSRAYHESVSHIYEMGAVLGLNDAPPPRTYSLRAHYPGGSKPVQLIVAWETLAEHEAVGPDLSVLMHVVFDEDAKVFPAANWRGEASAFLDMADELFAFWTMLDECLLEFDDNANIHLKRDDDTRVYSAKFNWVAPLAEIPPYADFTVLDDQPATSPQDPTRAVVAFYNLPNVDALDITRQIMDVARTLLALLDARGLSSTNTRHMARQLDDLERLLAPLLGGDGGSAPHGQ